METVDVIKDKEKLKLMKEYLKKHSLRDWLLFTLGINSALRISDLLSLTVEDVDGMTRLNIKESKTSKKKSFQWNAQCIADINEYLDTLPARSGTLFPSRKSVNGVNSAITRQHAYSVINEAAWAVGVITKKNGVRIGAHSLRKTFGYHMYNNGASIEVIMSLLNHSTPKVSLRYIGITQETLDEVYTSTYL